MRFLDDIERWDTEIQGDLVIDDLLIFVGWRAIQDGEPTENGVANRYFGNQEYRAIGLAQAGTDLIRNARGYMPSDPESEED